MFVRKTSRSLAFYFFALGLLLRRNYCNVFCDCISLGVRKRFLHVEMGFLLPLVVDA